MKVIVIGLWFLVVLFFGTEEIIVGVLWVGGESLIAFELFFGGMAIDGIGLEFGCILIDVDVFGGVVDLHFGFVKDAAVGGFGGLDILKLGFGENYLLTTHNTKLKLFIFFLN